jgi:hypothetical protein
MGLDGLLTRDSFRIFFPHYSGGVLMMMMIVVAESVCAV